MKTILLVEDDWSLALHWQALLEKEGFFVVFYNKVRPAIDLLVNTDVDLVITDILIASEDGSRSVQGGLEIISFIALNLNPLPAIITVSGGVGQSSFVDRNFDRLDAMQALRKPISDADFLKAVNDSLSRKEKALSDKTASQPKHDNDSVSQQLKRSGNNLTQQSTELLLATQYSLKRTQFSLDHAPEGVMWIDQNGKFLYVNRWFCSFLGYTQKEMLDRTVADINPHISDDDFFKSNIWPKISRSEYKAEVTHQRKDGRIVPVEVTAWLMEYEDDKIACAYVRDITDRLAKEKQAKLKSREELAEANKALEAMVKLIGSSDGVWSWQIGKEEAKYAPGFRRLLGFAPDDLDGFPETLKAFESRVHTDDISKMWDSISKSYEDKSDFVHELRILNLSGEYIWIRSRGAVSFDEFGNPQQLAGSIYDISEVKAAQIELERQSRALARSNADLTSFAYVASHDLQEPLRAVSGFLQLLETKYASQLDEQGRGYIKKAVDGASRMSQLIFDLLRYSRLSQQESFFEPVDMKKVVSEVKKELEEEIREKSAVIDCGDLPVISGARPLLVQLFRNIIGNAIKYRSDAPPQVSISSITKNGWCTIEVQDNGIGIAKEYRDQVFDLFKRLHRREEHSGTGIGLAICRRVVERHGGSIEVSEGNGTGSCFKIGLPVEL